jgi:hypothetical protein
MKAMRGNPVVRTDNRAFHPSRFDRDRLRRALRRHALEALRTALFALTSASAALIVAVVLAGALAVVAWRGAVDVGDRALMAVLDPSPAMNRNLYLVLFLLGGILVGLCLCSWLTAPAHPRDTRSLTTWRISEASEFIRGSSRLTAADSRIAAAISARGVHGA